MATQWIVAALFGVGGADVPRLVRGLIFFDVIQKATWAVWNLQKKRRLALCGPKVLHLSSKPNFKGSKQASV